MKIAKVIHHGQTRYRVNDPSGPDGKRQRKFFDTCEAAEAYVKDRSTDKKEFGLRFVTQPPAERAVIAYQLHRLKELGWTLPAAVDFIEKHGQEVAPSLTLGQVADKFLAAKQTAGLRPRYLKTLRASINRFLLNRRQKLIGDITASEIQEYISSNGWLPATMRSYLVDVRTLFAFCREAEIRSRQSRTRRGFAQSGRKRAWHRHPSAGSGHSKRFHRLCTGRLAGCRSLDVWGIAADRSRANRMGRNFG